MSFFSFFSILPRHTGEIIVEREGVRSVLGALDGWNSSSESKLGKVDPQFTSKTSKNILKTI